MSYPPSINNYINFDGFGGIFFINSPERFVIVKMKEELCELVKDRSEKDIISYDMNEDKNIISEAVNTAREIGFFSSQKIIVLELSAKLTDKDRKMLEEYIDTSEQNNFLIVFISEIDKRTKFFKSLRQMKKIYFEIHEPGPADIRQFVRNEFQPFKADGRVEDFFVNSPDRDLFYFHNEIEKIKLFAESHGITDITFDKVDSILYGLSEQVIFKIMDMLVEGKKADAVKLYRETMITEGEYKVNPLIISMFFRHFRGIMKARILLRDGKSSELQSFLNKNRLFYMKRSAESLAGKYKNIELLQALRKLSEVELGMKGVYGIGTSSTTVELEQFMALYF